MKNIANTKIWKFKGIFVEEKNITWLEIIMY